MDERLLTSVNKMAECLVDVGKQQEKYSKRQFIISMSLIVAITSMLMFFTIGVSVMSKSIESMQLQNTISNQEIWRIYMTSDYDYGTINQTTDVTVGGD